MESGVQKLASPKFQVVAYPFIESPRSNEDKTEVEMQEFKAVRIKDYAEYAE